MIHVVLLMYMAILGFLSLIPAETDQDQAQRIMILVPPTVQNIMHVPAYGILTWFMSQSLRTITMARGGKGVLAVGLAIGYGTLLEVWQLWIPGRYPSVTDALLNAGGSMACGVLLWRRI